MGVRAKIEQSNPKKPPTMGEGDVDASVLWDWFNRSENFFRQKSITADNRVVSIAWGMSGVHAVRWLSANSPLLDAMSWDDYKEHMRTLFLPSDWEHAGRMDVLRLQQGSRSFVEFSLDMMGRNNLLAGTDSFFNDEALRDTMDANMDRELARECNRENVTSITSFRDWLDEVKRLDERKRQRMEEIERTLARINAKSNNNRATSTVTRPPFQPRNTNAPVGTNTGSFTPMPKLTDDERALLSANGGCYKCRARCTAPAIDASKYKTLTSRDVPPRPANYSIHNGASRSAVAAIINNNDASSASIEPVADAENLAAPAVAAVMPENEGSSWISSGSWSDDEYAPFSCSNLFWRFAISPPSPFASPVSQSVNGLIDNGSAVVLIKGDIADALKLERHLASTPFK
ncbi:hypothetical protein BDN71DRAFT_1435181, partial [Pleurotus eryngii]